MKQFSFPYAISFVLLFTVSLKTYAQNGSFRNSVSITQGNNHFTFTGSLDTIQLKRDSFAIEFESKKYTAKNERWYATQIAAVTCDSCIALLKPGQKIEKIPFFSEGTGLASEEFGYGNLFINNEAHHYITYTSGKDRRAELLSVKGDLLRLKWNVPLAYYNDQDVAFNKLPLNSFYLVILNDLNLNQIMEEAEFVIVLVTMN